MADPIKDIEVILMPDGLRGLPGMDAYELAVSEGFEGTLDEWLESIIGPEGKNTYELAVEEGFEGTLEEWLESLRGPKGDQGERGPQGPGLSDEEAQEVLDEVDTLKQQVIGIGSGEGGKGYPTLADALAADIPDNVIFQVDDVGIFRRDSSHPDGAVFLRDFPIKPEKIGVHTIPSFTNILSNYSLDLEDPQYWAPGFLHEDGTIGSPTSPVWRHTVEYLRVYPGRYQARVGLEGSARILMYNQDHEIIGNFSEGEEIIVPDEGMWLKASVSNIIDSPSIENVEALYQPTDRVFATPESVSQKVQDELENFGLKIIPEGTNLFQELIDAGLDDSDLWGDGHLNEDGSVGGAPSWRHSKKYYRIPEGEYRLKTRIGEASKVLFYDRTYNVVSSYEGGAGWPIDYTFTTPEGVEYIRISFNGTPEHLQTDLLLETYQDIYVGGGTETVGRVSELNTTTPVNGSAVASLMRGIYKDSNFAKPKTPIVSFISDDGHIENEWYISILEEKGIKSSFAIITDRFGFSTALSKERVLELAAQGHDIISHTHTHPRMSEHTDGEIDYTIRKAKMELKALNIDSDLFVSPHGDRNARIDGHVRKYHKANFVTISQERTRNGEGPNIPPLNTFNIKRVGFDDQNETRDLQYYLDVIDDLVAQGGWVVFTIHPQFPIYHPSDEHDYMEARQELRDLIDYIQSLDIPILTAQQAFDFYKNPVEIGGQTVDDKWYALGMDGSEEGNYFE